MDALNKALAVDPKHADASARLQELNRRRTSAERAKAVADEDRARRTATLRAEAAIEEARTAEKPQPSPSPVVSSPGATATATQTRRPVKYFMIGGMLGGVLVVGALVLVAILAAAYMAGRSDSGSGSVSTLPGSGSPPIDPQNLVTPPVANGVVTPEIQAQLIDAVNRGESAAILAFRTLNPSGLAGLYTGGILANLSAQIQTVARNGVYGVVQRHNQQFESFTLSPDGRKAEVRLTENWSANFHSVVTQACVSHFHQRDTSQTQFLELTPQGWVIYALKEDAGPQQLAACH
jgi:hypothetical protein